MFGNLNYYLNAEYLLAAKKDSVLTIGFVLCIGLRKEREKA